MQIYSQIRGRDDSEKAEELARAIMIYLDESQEPKALEEKCPECHYQNGDHHARRCSQRREEKPETQESGEKCRFDREVGYCFTHSGFHEAKPQDEPKECCELCECASYVDGVKTESKCNSKDCPCHQESETGWREDLAISHLRIVLPMAKAYAASSDVGSNREFVEAADIFLKSLEK